jgi:hypothetical protein
MDGGLAMKNRSSHRKSRAGSPPRKPARFPGAANGKKPINEPLPGETALSPDSIEEEPDPKRSIADTGPDGIQGEIAEGVPSEPDPALRKSDT